MARIRCTAHKSVIPFLPSRMAERPLRRTVPGQSSRAPAACVYPRRCPSTPARAPATCVYPRRCPSTPARVHLPTPTHKLVVALFRYVTSFTCITLPHVIRWRSTRRSRVIQTLCFSRVARFAPSLFRLT
jgi:hypothetical protein